MSKSEIKPSKPIKHNFVKKVFKKIMLEKTTTTEGVTAKPYSLAFSSGQKTEMCMYKSAEKAKRDFFKIAKAICNKELQNETLVFGLTLRFNNEVILQLTN